MLRIRLFPTVFGVCASLALFAGTATAQPISVCAAACDFSNLQAAIDASPAAGVVSVSPGTYAGPITISRWVNVRAVTSTSDVTFTVTGDGTAPTVTIVAGSSLENARVEGAGDIHPALVVEAAPIGSWDAVAGIRYSVVEGGNEGVVVAAGAAAGVRNVSLVGNSAVAIRLLGGGIGASLTATDVSVAGSMVGIDAAGSHVDAERVRVVVAAGGIAGRFASTEANLRGLTVEGIGAVAARGIEFTDAHINSSKIIGSRFANVSPAIRFADAPLGNAHEVTGNLFEMTQAAPPLVDERGAVVRGSRNFVACPDVDCPVAGGPAAASMSVTALVPQLEFAVAEGLPFGTSPADSDVELWVRFDEGSREGSALSELPIPLATASVNFDDGPDARPTVGQDKFQYLVHTGAAGQTLSVTARVLGRPVRTSRHIVGTTPAVTARGGVSGVARIGRTLRCHPPTWAVAPASVSYKWSGGGTPNADRTLTHLDILRNGVSCIVVATFADYRNTVVKFQVKAVLEPLRLDLSSLNAGWRIVKCGAGPTKACSVTRRIGIRFWVQSGSRKHVRAEIELQRRVKGRWEQWVAGSVRFPLKGGVVIPGRLVGPGTYRLQLSVPRHDVFEAAHTRWLHVRVR
ncbi:MAG: hypothetical protein H7287_10075 [Thermoleophilia bacterium]|nr:hypothetical protein [Thermoleophilia bacterium]